MGFVDRAGRHGQDDEGLNLGPIQARRDEGASAVNLGVAEPIRPVVDLDHVADFDSPVAVRFCDAAEDLKQGRPAAMADLAAFTSWDQVVEYAEQATDAADWKMLVALIDKHGVDKLRAALGSVVDERDAEVLVVTAHKSKGREWGRVRLAEDLAEHLEKARNAVAEAKLGVDPQRLHRARRHLADELMLSYVAVTRAQDTLNPGLVVCADSRESAPAA
ncbi:P-loop NTPase family protein [Nocardia bovistercoris]|uniref:DNA helicase n=1 Tax=Nocardia bovistercoris TaxID=2785916 RepID=A0A931N503_9NOCA|nr:hypothetical protein [Nocardia bovistercoris]MBH0778836.1 hypothetical protein [Nocardia bovistercoris]